MKSKPGYGLTGTRWALPAFLAAGALMVFGAPASKAQETTDETMADTVAATTPVESPQADKFIAMDFGSREAMEGFASKVGGEGVIFAGNVKFERGAEPNWPDPLISDYATADYLTVIGLDKGAYRAAVIAQNVAIAMVPAEDFSISSGGGRAVFERVPPDRFFSAEGLFYGVQFEDVPGVDWWARYVEPAAPWRKFSAESNGRLRLDLDNCRLYALVLANESEVTEAEFDVFLSDVRAKRKAYFLTNSFRFEPGAPEREFKATNRERRQGYAVFSRYWGEDVTYNSVPTAGERLKSISIAGARGERVPFTVSVRAVNDLKGVNVTVSNLTNDQGDVIRADSISVKGVRYKLRAGRRRSRNDQDKRKVFHIAPEVLQDQPSLDVPADVAKRWWVTVTVPPDAARGKYAGEVTIVPSNAAATSVPLELEVYPFDLAETNASIGLWYDDPSTMGYSTALAGGTANVWPAPYDKPYQRREITRRNRWVDSYRAAMLEADLKLISERGFNGITTPLPTVRSVSPIGDVTMDFSVLDAYLPLLAKYGINTEFAGQCHLLGIGRQIVNVGTGGRRIPEYSDLHAAAFKSAYRAMQEYYERAGIKMLAYVVDEPRERNINPWNRNMEGTLYYLRLANEVGGWPSTVTTMADTNNGISYMPILKEEDVVQPHPGSRNVRSVDYARMADKPVRYFNGSGFHRYPYGFYIWSQKPEGYWQWHYQFWTHAFNPVWEENVGYAVYPSPEGPLSTPRLERAAAGIFDYRYCLTLEEHIARGFSSGIPLAATAAAEGQYLLDETKRDCTKWVLDDDWDSIGVPDETLIEWRAKIVEAILAIEAALP